MRQKILSVLTSIYSNSQLCTVLLHFIRWHLPSRHHTDEKHPNKPNYCKNLCTYFPKAKHSRVMFCPTKAVVSGNFTRRSAGYFLLGPDQRSEIWNLVSEKILSLKMWYWLKTRCKKAELTFSQGLQRDVVGENTLWNRVAWRYAGVVASVRRLHLWDI